MGGSVINSTVQHRFIRLGLSRKYDSTQNHAVQFPHPGLYILSVCLTALTPAPSEDLTLSLVDTLQPRGLYEPLWLLRIGACIESALRLSVC
jgi:hypothetical protein